MYKSKKEGKAVPTAEQTLTFFFLRLLNKHGDCN